MSPGETNKALALAGAAFVLPAAVLLAGGLGYILDRRLGTMPWLTLAGVMLGMAAGFVEILRLLRQVGD
jgi:F0F1-type ATP synthase assembly protein I